MTVDVAVIGGGISGLAAAFDLKRQGHKVVVLERQVRAGGNAISESFSGFLMEHGPSTVNVTSTEAARFSSEAGIDDMRCDLGEGVKERYLVNQGRLHGIPVHPMGFLLSDYLSLKGRLRMMLEFAVPARAGTEPSAETIADFCVRRFGREFADRVVDPLVGGLFAGRASELSVQSMFPKLLRMEREYGSVTRGIFKARRRAKMPGRRLYSWRRGIGSLPGALAARLGSDVITGATVRGIRRFAGGFHVDVARQDGFNARAVILATQPHVTASLLEATDETTAAAIASIDAPPLAVVFLGYRRAQVEHPLDGLGYLVPEAEGRVLTGAQFCSTMFPGRAPEGHVAIAGYIGGARAPDLARQPAGELIAATRREFREMLGARGEPVVARIRQWPQGLPQYRTGHGAKVETILSISRRTPGLFVTGNYLTGPAVAACLQQAAKTALNVDAYLSGSRTQNETAYAASAE